MGDDLITIISREGTLRAGVNPKNGQLCSLQHKGQEFMWGGGKPEHLKAPHEKKEAGGWQNSAITMSPLVSQAAGDKITIDGQELTMPQHGIVRYMQPIMCERAATYLTTAYVHEARSVVQTPKGAVSFPRSFRLLTRYHMNPTSLRVQFEVENIFHKPLPFALGWHPAFLDLGGMIEVGDKTLTVQEIAEASASKAHGAIVLPGETDAKYTSADGRVTIAMKTEGFGNMQVWRQPGPQPVLCIEPISALPQITHTGEFATRQGYGPLAPDDKKDYSVRITPTVVT